MKTQVRNSGNISTGEVRSFEHTLSADSKMDSTLTIPMIGFTKAAVSIQTIGAVGTSGNVLIKQSVREGGPYAEFTAPISKAIAASGTVEEYDIDVSGGYLIVDLSQVTQGDEGRFDIVVIIKRQ